MSGFSFIHAADLHLDSPFVGTTAQGEIAAALRGSTFAAFERLVETCMERKAAFLLIAGDVYDSQDRSLRAQLALRNGLARLAEARIHTYMVQGNHAPLRSRVAAREWPPEVHVFGADEVQSLAVEARGGRMATINGISFSQAEELRNLAAMLPPVSGPGINIGLLHCNVGSGTGHEPYAPCDPQDLKRAGMDYWALGHVHEHCCLTEDPLTIYPGNIQGRSIRETGPRGCYLVEVNAKGEMTPEFICLDQVRWEYGRVMITDLHSVDALMQQMNQQVEQLLLKAEGRSLVCRLRLEGRGEIYQELKSDEGVGTLLENLRETWRTRKPFAWVQSLDLRCGPEVDLEKRQEANDLLGEVLRGARRLREDDACVSELTGNVFADLFNSAKVKRAGLHPPTNDEIKAMLDAAAIEALDLLE